ncbi:DUF3244 domain-containing protein, partial [Phocaeicola vulgatus]|uniref:DUF3244 domain-containing protein n=1 Tax=Phocaeicola vulgatus TaxID=821 RepID=UPI0032E3C526
PISRSIIQTANAYLYNNTVCVDFNEVLPNVTITLINESTSKLIHSEAYNEPTNIDITLDLSLIHISEPTRRSGISYAVIQQTIHYLKR